MSELYARRREALRTQLRERGLDALLVVDLLNIRYLTGFTGSNAALAVSAADGPADEKNTVFCTDGRYLTQAGQQVPDLERLIDRPSATALVGKLATQKTKHRRTGYESHHVTVEQLDGLADAAGGVELIRAPGMIEKLRIVKDDTEVEALRMACAAADRALADLMANGGLRPGRTEREVARELEDRMLANGAEKPSFETIVAAGANSAIPHHRPTDAVLKPGDFVKMDFGALVDGYHSDMTRTVVLGEPADWQREIYELVAESQAAGRAALKPGADVKDIDAASRDVIDRAGRGAEFLHGLGHGVGLQIHEAPSLAKTGEGTLSAGMAVTVEPGVYLAGKGGVRIEDTLVVREAGPELLTLTTKQLMVV
ncbi:aminopeptidase P family protein [Kibdelosporangium phytohabitans]|uniref:X-Pro dipeptidase n=1 Tax=Kibdelosporangium phytohabitans TaxID=860235 RepID=A0A0N9I683_9PSEU|nr:Xaa-Pro peptidase family protein [Kibdelosporangium phytohabitans]ALG11686.1 X-Pro dipeptidase [Kibdelosporangium phytohabitans]MBE1463076.1 Xaa-Pro dipeptidase [Kibdelosporangium phytohabitans]